jgi:hypothetical protein
VNELPIFVLKSGGAKIVFREEFVACRPAHVPLQGAAWSGRSRQVGDEKGHAAYDRAAFLSRRRRRQVHRRVSGTITGAGGKVAAGALISTASGAGS